MSRQSSATYKTTITSEFPTTGTGQITASRVRTYIGQNGGDSFMFIIDHAYSSFMVTASGTDTYTATLDPAITAYSSGQRFFILFTNANTGAATLNLNALGAKSIVKNGSTALSAADITAGRILCLVYDGTNLQIV